MPDPREVTKLVLADDWTMKGALTVIEPSAITQAIASHEGVMSLMESDPTFQSREAEEVRTWLKPIGMKCWPDMADKAKADWLSGMMVGLSDLPAKVAISATKKAVHLTYRFPNEVEPKIREFAGEIMDRHRIALARLKAMREEIERAANPAPALEAPVKIWTVDEIRESNRMFRKMRIKTRFLYTGAGEPKAFEIKERGQIDADVKSGI